MSQDQAFWRIVKDLNWKLDDGRSGPPPAAEPEFIHTAARGRESPVWLIHVIAFLLGAVSSGILLVAPALLPALGLWALGAVGVLAFLRRKR